jgi:glycosyltransferase involved in cell wall biosynthesis
MSRSLLDYSDQIDAPNQADFYHFRWVPGIVNPFSFSQARDKPVIWTIPDEWAFTGGCHYAFDCKQLTQGCVRCPSLRFFSRGIPSLIVKHKIDSINKGSEKVHIVAPTLWLAERAKASLVFSNIPVHVIPNPINPIYFENPKNDFRNTPMPKEKVFICIAEDLSDPVKNINGLLQVLVAQASRGFKFRLELVGGMTHPLSLPDFCSWRGRLTPLQLADVIEEASALILPSEAEAAGMVIAEAAAKGKPSIGLASGGIPEMIESYSAGWTFDNLLSLVTFLSEVSDSQLHAAGLAAKKNAQKLKLSKIIMSYLDLVGIQR